MTHSMRRPRPCRAAAGGSSAQEPWGGSPTDPRNVSAVQLPLIDSQRPFVPFRQTNASAGPARSSEGFASCKDWMASGVYKVV